MENILDSYKFINSYNLPTLGSQLEVAGNIYLYDVIHIGYRDFPSCLSFSLFYIITGKISKLIEINKI